MLILNIQWMNSMETKFNFNSQICTTRGQSERLLALGLKKETADCALLPLSDEKTAVLVKPSTNDIKNTIPAWSLHRLIEMALKDVLICGISFTFEEDAYEKVIWIIEYQIDGGYFNKEYLV